jgi:DNA-binding SARP family transcriptional activator
MIDLDINLLGEFNLVYRGQQVISINQLRQQSLLGYLALNGRAPVSRQYLAFLFWPDLSKIQARNNLRQALHQLRHSLPDSETRLQVDASAIHWNLTC